MSMNFGSSGKTFAQFSSELNSIKLLLANRFGGIYAGNPDCISITNISESGGSFFLQYFVILFPGINRVRFLNKLTRLFPVGYSIGSYSLSSAVSVEATGFIAVCNAAFCLNCDPNNASICAECNQGFVFN